MTRQEAQEVLERIESALTVLSQIDYREVFSSSLQPEERDIAFLGSETANVYMEMKRP